MSHRQGGEAVDGRESQRPRNLNVAELYKDLMCLDKAQAWRNGNIDGLGVILLQGAAHIIM